LARLHLREHTALWFGTGLGERFNDPQELYGVCYLAFEPEAAFVETLLRARNDDVVALAAIEARAIASVPIARSLRLVAPFGRHLSALHATAAHGRYVVSQAWSRALHDHPDAPDGIAYRPAHDDALTAVALFERARGALGPPRSRPLIREYPLLDRLAERYAFVVV
jgi:hypothetical protein